MKRHWQALVARMHALDINDHALLMIFAALVGAGGGLGVVAFYKLIDLAYDAFYAIPGDHFTRSAIFGYRPILTALGLLAAAAMVRRFSADKGMAVPDVQVAVARSGGYVATRPAIIRTLASAVTLGSGGSAGSEGPVAVLGSGIGSWIGRTFGFDSNHVSVMVAAGAAAGIAAAFNAPLAGAFFALEEILGSFSAIAFAPVVVASVIGAVISRAFFGNHPAFPIPHQYSFHLSTEIFLLFPLLGVVCGVTAALFVKTYFKAGDVALKFGRHHALRAIVGGLLVGLIVFVSRGALVGYGHLAVRLEIFGRMAWYSLALLALGKIVATSITLNFGGSGGVFTPSLYLGAATGGAFGVAASKMLPVLQLSPEAYALVGMGAMVAAATDAPITGILIVFEMTNDYAIMPALMLVVAIAAVVCRRLEPDSLYSGYLRRKGEAIPHTVDRDVLSHLRVLDVYQPVTPVRADAPLSVVLDHVAQGVRADVPVCDADGTLRGMITVEELARAAHEQNALNTLVVAQDLAVPAEAVMPQDSLISVIQKMSARGVAALPVLDPQTGKLIGIIARAHILSAYIA